jgi:hypothetical protein
MSGPRGTSGLGWKEGLGYCPATWLSSGPAQHFQRVTMSKSPLYPSPKDSNLCWSHEAQGMEEGRLSFSMPCSTPQYSLDRAWPEQPHAYLSCTQRGTISNEDLP